MLNIQIPSMFLAATISSDVYTAIKLCRLDKDYYLTDLKGCPSDKKSSET